MIKIRTSECVRGLPRRRDPRRSLSNLLAVPALSLALAVFAVPFGGCAPRPPVRVVTARTGEIVVTVIRPMSVVEVARQAYGDAALAGPVARLAGLEPGDRVAAGAVLVLPSRDDLEGRLAADRAAEDLYQRGLRAADAGTWQEAIGFFERALASAPHRLDARYNLGLAALRAGELERATSVLGAVAAARPGDTDSRYAFGTVLRRRRAWDRALAEFRAAVRVDPGHAAAQFAVARTLEDLGLDSEAIGEWNRFLQRFPADDLAPSATERLTAAEARRRGGPDQ